VTDLDKLAGLLFKQKGTLFYVPLKNLWVLLRNYYLMTRIVSVGRRSGAKLSEVQVGIILGLAKWIQRGLEKPDHNVLSALFCEEV
jgi:hypothetical protein